MKLDEGKKMGNDATMHVMQNEGDIKSKLATSLFATFVNKDSLQRRIPQEVMFHVEFLITTINSCAYALLVGALQKDDTNKELMQDSMASAITDLLEMQHHFNKNADILNTRKCKHE